MSAEIWEAGNVSVLELSAAMAPRLTPAALADVAPPELHATRTQCRRRWSLRRDVTAVLDAQLERVITRDRDPRPPLRKQLGKKHSAFAFVSILYAVWGLETDNKPFSNVISFELLHL